MTILSVSLTSVMSPSDQELWDHHPDTSTLPLQMRAQNIVQLRLPDQLGNARLVSGKNKRSVYIYIYRLTIYVHVRTCIQSTYINAHSTFDFGDVLCNNIFVSLVGICCYGNHFLSIVTRNAQLKPLEKPKTPALPMEELVRDFSGLRGQRL